MARHRRARPLHELPYRPCVGIVLLNREGLVFLGRRYSEAQTDEAADAYAWQMPQGGIDTGESPREAAFRELHEETGVRSAELLAEAPEWYCYDLPSVVAGRAWRGRFRGQSQKWFAFRFTGEEREIAVTTWRNDQEPEFDAWRWERLARVPELVVPFRREIYRAVAREFSRFAG